jgi:hypothetical protein
MLANHVMQACQWALHLCKQAGVKFILHPVQGCFDGFIESGCVLNQRVLGVSTKDGVEHRAHKVIVACECGDGVFHVGTARSCKDRGTDTT